MKIALKTSEIIQMTQAMRTISGRPLPTEFSHAISVNSRKLAIYTQAAEEQRLALGAIFADKDEKGRPIVVKDQFGNSQWTFSDREAFEAEWKKVTDEPQEVDMKMVGIALIGPTIEPGIFDALSPMILDENEGDAKGLVLPMSSGPQRGKARK